MYHHTIVHLGPQRHEISLRHLDFVFGPHPVQKNPGQLGALDLNQSGLALRDHFAACARSPPSLAAAYQFSLKLSKPA
jgi:hypothetical protein